MKSYVGKDITEAMVDYGTPDARFDMPDGRVAFQWRRSDVYGMPITTTMVGTTPIISGGGVFSTDCVYTAYARPNAQKSYTIVGFEQPRFDCE